MKLIDLITSNLFAFVVSQPLANADKDTGDVWIDSNPDRRLINASTIHSKYVFSTNVFLTE